MMKRLLYSFIRITLLLAAFSARATSPTAAVLPEDPALPRLQVQLGHGFFARSMALSPNAHILASGGADHNVHLWHAATGRLLRQIAGHKDDVTDLSFSLDSRQLASVDEGGVAKVWDVATGRQLATLGNPGQPIRRLSYLSDGSLLLVASTGLARWTPPSADAAPLGTAQNLGDVIRLSRTLDGTVVAIAADTELGELPSPLALWDQTTSRFVALGAKEASRESLRGMALSQDGPWLAVSWGYAHKPDTRLELWDTRARRLATVRQLGIDQRVDWLAFDASGRLIGSKSLRKRFDFPSGIKETVVMFSLPGLAESPKVTFEPAMPGFEVLLSSLDAASSRLALLRPVGPIQIVDLGTGTSIGLRQIADDPRGLVFRDLERIGVTGRRTYTRWNPGSRTVDGYKLQEETLAVSPDGRFLLTQDIADSAIESYFNLRDLDSGKRIASFAGGYGIGWSAVFSRDGRLVAVGAEYPRREDRHMLTVFDTQAQAKVASIKSTARRLLFSGDNRALFFQRGGRDPRPAANLRWDFLETTPPQESPTGTRRPIAASKDGKLLALHRDSKVWVASSDGTTWVRGPSASGTRSDNRVLDANFSLDSRLLATANSDGTVSLYSHFGSAADAADSQTTPMQHRVLTGHSSEVLSVRFSDDGKWLASISRDQTTSIWNVASGHWVARLIEFNDGTWSVVDPAGRFDTNSLESNPGLHWIMPDDPLQPVGLELFMRDFYEPGLLSRVMAGEVFPAVPPITKLKRVQPLVTLTSIRDDPTLPGRVRVEVRVTNVVGRQSHHDLASGAHDLAVFRGGQRVAGIDGDLSILPGQSRSYTFTGIQRPRASEPLTFTAYAFNDDKVKSNTTIAEFTPQRPLQAGAGRRAYIVSIGVDSYSGPFTSLRYAVADAKAIQQTLTRLLQSNDRQVTPILLVSERGASSTNATRADLETVFRLLAGKPVAAERKARIPNADKIRAAAPDDMLIVSFAGHGLNGENGRFHLVPAGVMGSAMDVSTLAQTISSDDLADWLKDVDAGEMVMILDACHSASAVAGEEGFKPGPMGSRGLGQLAYNKGVRILAATQAADVALESDRFKHGLLTYALVREGIEDGRADFDPKDDRIYLSEWLQWGVNRVPQLWREATSGVLVSSRGATRLTSDGERSRSARGQKPTLFDFTRWDRRLR